MKDDLIKRLIFESGVGADLVYFLYLDLTRIYIQFRMLYGDELADDKFVDFVKFARETNGVTLHDLWILQKKIDFELL